MTALARREAILRERLEAEHGPALVYLFTAVICNGCGMTVKARNAEQLARMLPGWRLGGYGEDSDYCPGCLR